MDCCRFKFTLIVGIFRNDVSLGLLLVILEFCGFDCFINH